MNYVPLSGGGYVIPQLDDYNYDALNRNTSVTEAQQNSAGTWTFNLFTQNFGYDRWGNRTVSCSPCQSGVTGDNFTIDTTTNRITAKNGVGMTYDSAGNQTYDATGNRWFDGENKMYKAVQSGTTSYYVYDADGKRVRRIVGATETWMVYGIDGEMVAEYSANGASGSPQKEYGYRGGQMLIVAQTSPLEIRWTVPDHLGTPRMNIMGNGASGGLLSSVKRHDYLPFGEELVAGVGLRSSSSHGYEPPSDGVRQKFTDKERDTETGLDYFSARFLASVQGRFTSVDPVLISEERLFDPQAINLYAYCGGSPLSHTDPNGKYFVGTNGERVDVSVKNGVITLGKNASDDLKKMAKLISESSSKKALSQFMSVAGNTTKVNFRIETSRSNTDLGLHQAHDNNGNVLKWEANSGGTGKFNGNPSFVKGIGKGEVSYEEATITIYETDIKDDLKAIQEVYGDPSITVEEAMVATFSHEADHDVNQQAIKAIKARQEGRINGFNVEDPAERVEKQVYTEIKASRKRK